MNKLSLPTQASMHGEPQPLAVSVERGAKLIGIGRTSMWNCVSAGLVQVVRISNRTLIPYTELEKLMTRSQAEIDATLASYKVVVEGRKGRRSSAGVASSTTGKSQTRREK